MDASSLPQLLPLLQTLLASPSPLTLGATLTAFSEMCPDRLDLLHPYYRHICHLLVDADEWGQIVALGVLTRYARAMLEKPEVGVVKPADGEESEDEFAGIDLDLAMFLDCARPLFQSRNPAVVLGIAKAYYHLAPAGHATIGQELLASPLLRLASAATSPEVAALTWDVIASMIAERPVCLPEPEIAHSLILLADAVCFPSLEPILAFIGPGSREDGQAESNDVPGVTGHRAALDTGVQGELHSILSVAAQLNACPIALRPSS